ncbi:MAG TPA: DUF6785 family protein [Abditibacteriaceae bacterium]|jgi:hypothetical protein
MASSVTDEIQAELSNRAHERPVAEDVRPGAAPPMSGMRLRAFLVGLPLVCGISFISVYADMVSRVVQFGVLQFAPPAIAILFFLALLNRGLTKWSKREWLAPGDMLIIYSMMLISVLVSTRGVVEKLVPSLTWLPYNALPADNLHTKITQYLPAWAVPFVPSANPGRTPAVTEFYEGSRSGSLHLSTWLGPLLCWLALVGCIIWVFACLATLLRRQWMDNEQLRFPLTTLPLAIMKDEIEGQPFFTNRTMWMGFALSAIVFGINGLSKNYTDWPAFVTFFPLNQYFTERPLNMIEYSPLYISLAAIGFAYFLPLDLLFSFWFFFLFTRFQDVLTIQFGGLPRAIGTHNARVFTGYQAAGAYVVIIAAQLRIAWPYFKQVWRTAFGPRSKRPLDDSNELMTYRTALIGLALGVGGIVLWLSLAGMNPLLAFAQMGIYIFFITIIMSRAVAEGGFLMTETSFLPTHLINLVVPLQPLGAQNLSILGLTNAVFVRDLRGGLLSPLLDAQKMARETRTRYRALLLPLGATVLLAYFVGNWAMLHFAYQKGALALYSYPSDNARNMFKTAATQIDGSWLPPDATAYGGFGVGIVVTTLLVWMRANFTWFPFHPLAYAIAPTWAMLVFWFPFFVAWLIKSLVLRFGGIETFRRISPFMLGMILGEFTLAVFWAVMNMTRGWSTPDFPWP